MDRKQKEQKKGIAGLPWNRSKRIKQDSRRTYVKKADRKRRYLFLGCGMALLSVMLAAALFFFFGIVDRTIEEQSKEILTGTASRNARMLEYEIGNKRILLERVAERCGDLFRDDSRQVLSELEPLIELYEFYDLGIILEDGTFFSVGGKTGDFSGYDFFQRTMQGDTVLSSTMTADADETRVNLYCTPMTSDGTPIGAIYAAYETEKFNSLFATPFSGNSYSYVADSSGQVMIAKNGNYGNLLEGLVQEGEQNREEQEKMRRDMEEGREGSISFDSDEMKYAYYRPLEINDWYVVTIVPVRAVMERYDPIINSTTVLCLFVVLVFCLGAWLIVNQQRRQNRELEQLAYVDPLTGGKNNIRFLLDAADVLEGQREGQAAVLAVDINRFKMINEMLGVEAGNRAICGLEKTLLENSRAGEVVGHRIADCFLALWLYQDRETLVRRLEHLCEDLEALSGNLGQIHFQASVGVHEICRKEKAPVDTADVEQFCGSAMLAAQTLKSGHTTGFCFSSEEMRDRQLRNKIYEDEMYPALKRNEFVPWFQPKADLKTGKICGAEALVRWQKQDGTLLLPGQFVPVFEANGFIEKVDQAVMDSVCQHLVQWKAKNLATVPISVNLSRTYLYSEHFARECREYLQTKHLTTRELQFEVTETYAARDMEQLKKAIHALHTEGFTVLLDDFGTGYSSLLSLQELEFDILKLDCEFVWGIGEGRTEKILEATIELAKSLHMKMIAEGVETEAQHQYLKAHGVSAGQGYYYYRPMPAEEFEKLLRAQGEEKEST